MIGGMNRLAREASPYLRAARGQSRGLVSVGRGGVCRGARPRDEADLPVDRLLDLPLVPRDGARVVRGRRHRRAVLNRDFVCIKVDREERPDVDRVYMTFVQATTGSGGWPMSVWLTPALEPFYGGTYFPPTAAWGRPSFLDVLREIARAWREDRAERRRLGQRAWSRACGRAAPDRHGRRRGPMARCSRPARRSGRAPSTSGAAGSATRRSSRARASCCSCCASTPAPAPSRPRTMVLGTLRAMALGGMRDHVGGGFHRYSVDGDWRVPHFEKMLYDQAQLVLALLEAGQVSGDPFFAQVAEDTLALRRAGPDVAGRRRSTRPRTPTRCRRRRPGSPARTPPRAPSTSGRATRSSRCWGPTAGVWERRFGVQPGGNAPFDPQGEFGANNLFYTARTIADIAARQRAAAAGRRRGTGARTTAAVRGADWAAATAASTTRCSPPGTD